MEERPRVGIVFTGLVLVLLLAALDSTIVATALPTVVGELGVAGRPQPGRHGSADMKRRWGRVDEFAQALRRGNHGPNLFITGSSETLGSNTCPILNRCSRH